MFIWRICNSINSSVHYMMDSPNVEDILRKSVEITFRKTGVSFTTKRIHNRIIVSVHHPATEDGELIDEYRAHKITVMEHADHL